MAKASDNVFPKLIVSEQTTPASPSAGQQKLFVDSADHKLKRVNSGGAVTTIEGGGSGSSGGTLWPLGTIDTVPGTPNAKDDEFDGSSSVTWTSTPTAPNAWNINSTRAGHAYLKASGSGAALVGKHQPVPGSYPYTIVAKLSATSAGADFHRGGGIFLAPAAPTGTSNAFYCGVLQSSGRKYSRIIETLGGSFVSQSAGQAPGHYGPVYLRMVVTSATNVSSYVSTDGWFWLLIESAGNPGFTPGVMGVCSNEEGAAVGVESHFDFFRVT